MLINFTNNQIYQKSGYNNGMRYFLLSVLVVCIVGILMFPAVSSQQVTIPSWIKNNAGWWASDQIPDSAFLQGIQFLINEGIMIIPSTGTSESSGTEKVPTWIKNTAGWWADDKISEVEFVNAIQYLIKNGIIVVNNISSCTNDLSKIFDDSIITVQNTCDLHKSNEYLELVPFVESYTVNSLGLRGHELSEVKPPNTYRIFMVGGSTMFGSGASSDETTISGILQKLFASDNSVQKIEVINAGIQGANSNTELRFIEQKLVELSPDLVVVYDGLNDLKADFPVEKTKGSWESICKLSEIHGFDVIISLQPIPGFGNKKLTYQETVNSFTGEDHNGFQLITAKPTYDYVGRELLSLQDQCNVIDLRGIFDNISGPIYWDQGHVSDTANLILAEKFHGIINEIIFNKKASEDKFHDVISKYNSPIITSYLLSKIGIDVDYTKIKKQDITTQYKNDGNYFYLKNQLGGSEKILVGKDLSKSDLSKISLTGQNLSGVNLSGQDLRYVDLSDTLLRGADLSFTDLSGQNLSGKDLRGINFHGANLKNADLTDISISKRSQVYDPDPDNPRCLNSSDLFVDAILKERCVIDIIKNELPRTNFSNTNMKGVTISLAPPYDFIHFVNFDGADLTGVDLSNIKFRACTFKGANFFNNNMNNIAFVLCDFANAKFIESKAIGAVFHNVNFHNAKILDGNFQNTYFIDFVDFSGADLKDTLFVEPIMVGNIILSCENNEICN